MKIILATDHAGFELKNAIKDHLKDTYEVLDMGAHELNNEDDYPEFIIPAAKKVVEEDCLGIIFGGSGQGEAMAANRVKGVRAAVFYNGPDDIIKLSRQHNNANILSLGARFMNKTEIYRVIEIWLNEPFEGGRHVRRIEKLDD